MPYRCDFYSDEEYQQALAWEEEQHKEQLALAEYERECAYQEYLKEVIKIRSYDNAGGIDM